MNDDFQRDFKGVWIPKEIYLDTNLTWTDKILYCEINSLCGPDGCFASNEYFAKFLGVKERVIQYSLAKLKKLGLVVQIGFDGRQRILVATEHPIEVNAPQRCKKLHPRDAKDCTHSNIDYNRVYTGLHPDNTLDSNHPHPVSPSPSLTGETPEPPSRNSIVSEAVERFQEAWNTKLCDYCPKIAKITVFNETRRSKIKARLAEVAKLMKAQGIEKDLLTYFLRDIIYDRYMNSQFLRGEVPGRNGTDSFKMSIDHVMRPDFFAKMVEYRYDDRDEYRR